MNLAFTRKMSEGQAHMVFRLNRFNDFRDCNIQLNMVLFLLILGWAFISRFYGFSHAVTDGFDDWTYLDIAREWAEGKIRPDLAYAKPGYVLLATFAVKLLGYKETTLPLLNSSLDFINVVLVIALTRLSGLTLRSSYLAAFFYSVVPATILAARSGLPHSSSITCLLLDMIFFCLVLKFNNTNTYLTYLFAFFSGFFAAYAALTHPTLILFMLIHSGLFLSIYVIQKRELPGIMLFFVFSIGALAPFLFFSATCPGIKINEKFSALITSIIDHGQVPGAIKPKIQISFSKVSHYLVDIVSRRLFPGLFTVYIVVVATMSAATVYALKKSGMALHAAIKSISGDNSVVAYYFTISVLFFAGMVLRINGYQQWLGGERLFIPMIPLVVAACSVAQDGILNLFIQINLRRFAYSLILILYAIAFLVSFPFYIYTDQTFMNSLIYYVHKSGLPVSNDHKILILGTELSYPITHKYDLPSNSIVTYWPSKEGYDAGRLQDFVHKNNVQYILFTPVFYGMPMPNEDEDIHLKTEYLAALREASNCVKLIADFLEINKPPASHCYNCNPNILDQPIEFSSYYSIHICDLYSHIVKKSGRHNKFCLYEVQHQ